MRALSGGAVALLVAVSACGGEAPAVESLPTPSVGRATAVAGQPPVVWVTAQSEEVTDDHLLVVERSGARIRLERLAGDATRFFEQADGDWVRLPSEDVQLIEVGTPMCVESLLDGETFLALRVFVGAACAPAS